MLWKLSVALIAYIKVMECVSDSVWILESWCHINVVMKCINLGRTSLKAETWNAHLEWCVYKSLLPTLTIQQGRGVSGQNWQMVQLEEGWSFWSCCTVWQFLSFFSCLLLYFKETYVVMKEWGLSSGCGAFYKMTFKAAGRLACSYTKKSSTEWREEP